MKTVSPKVRCRVLTSSSKSPAPIGSRPEVGSSKNTRSGSSASARASATRLIMPPESSEGKRSATSGRNPTMPSFATVISSSNRWDRFRYSRTGNWMFCRTVREENSAPCWNRIPQRRSTPRRGIRGVKVNPENLDASADLGDKADDGARQHRLARAGRTDEAKDFAALHVEIEPVQNLGSAELNRDIANSDNGVLHLGRHRHIPIEAKKIANTPYITMTKKIPFTTDDVVCCPRDSALPCTASPSTQATIPITAAITGALMMPAVK